MCIRDRIQTNKQTNNKLGKDHVFGRNNRYCAKSRILYNFQGKLTIFISMIIHVNSILLSKFQS